MKKNILIVVKNLTVGGAEKQSILLAKALKNDFQVHYLILDGRYQEAKYMEILHANPEIKIKAFYGSLFSRFAQYTNYLKNEKIGTIFSYLTAANVITGIAAKLAGEVSVYSGLRNAYLPPEKALADRLVANYLAEKAILNCYSGKDFFLKSGFRISKLAVISNCFDNIQPYFKKENSTDEVFIITVGRFVAQKDYETALNAINILRKTNTNIKYKIVGYGVLENDIRAKIKSLDLSEYVELLIDPKNISELLNNADIYLSTSLFEGTSNSIMEGLNADLPVVATNVGDNFKLILHGENGYLADVKSPEEIAAFLQKLVEKKSLRMKMGQRSKEHLLEHFSIENFRNNYLTLLS